MFGGSSSSVIKNNRNLLKNNKREKFVYKRSKHNKVEKEKFDHLILNTEYCQNIRKKISGLDQNSTDAIILVSPAPVYGFTPIEMMQLSALNKTGDQSTKLDAECWIANEQQMTAFIDSFQLLPKLQDCYIFSGDVHYGFCRLQEEKKKFFTNN